MTSNIFYHHLPFTTLDYPGELASILFTKHCNMKCPYCYNLKWLSAIENPIENSTIITYLQKRRNMLSGVVLSGGEVLMDENCKTLYKFLFKVKDLGYKIKIDTNGSFPNNLRMLIDHELIDYVAMDIKSPDCFPLICSNENKNYFGIRRYSPQVNSFKTLVETDIPFELRSTMVYPFIDSESITKIAKLLVKEAGIEKIKSWYLQEANLDSRIILNTGIKMSAIPAAEIINIKHELEKFVTNVSIR